MQRRRTTPVEPNVPTKSRPTLLPNPKRVTNPASRERCLYDFYAGFSLDFASGVLSATCKPGESLAVDPWNGTGTTTSAARKLGVPYAGFDINPVMVVVARSQEYQPRSAKEAIEFARSVFEGSGSPVADVPDDDPLLAWFTPTAVAMLRELLARIVTALPSTSARLIPAQLEPQQCFLLVAFFRAIRAALCRFRTTNPGWLRVPASVRSRIRPVLADVRASTLREVERLASLIDEEPPLPKHRTLEVSPSTAIPLKAGTVDVVVSSPPYCTRLDYAMATRAELALLGYSPSNGLKDLRREMIGTPTVAPKPPTPDPAWGLTCRTFLNKVRRHPSKASATYYTKTHVQYFDRLFRSLGEIHRVLRAGGQCILVVQDSFYKEIHNNLALIVSEMTESFGWSSITRQDFPVQRLIANINVRARSHRTVRESTESVLWFRAEK